MTKSAVKKVFPVIFALTVFVFLTLPLLTEAQLGGIPDIDSKIIIQALAIILGWIAIGVGVGMLVLGFFRMGTSIGDPSIMGEAKQKILWGVIAIVIGGTLKGGFTEIIVRDLTFGWAIKEIASWTGLASLAVGITLLILSIFKIATSEGDSKMLSEGKTGLVWAAVAVAIGVALMQADKVYSLITEGTWGGN